MTSLYISYQSIREPLTWTQVAAYLEGLAREGRGMILLTFEPERLGKAEAAQWRRQLAEKGIAWRWLRYHKRPRLPATAWDLLAGIVTGWRIVRRHHAGLIHARCHVPGVMALVLKKLTGVKVLFDLRGLMAEEYADAGMWPAQGLLFRMVKRAERACIRGADAVVVLTASARSALSRWYPEETLDKTIAVIPCCVDRRNAPKPAAGRPPSRHKTLVYAGKLGGWYLTRAMAEFAAEVSRLVPELRWQVFTQSESAELRRFVAASELNGSVSIARLPPQELAQQMVMADGGINFTARRLSGVASSPTKAGEYLAAGLPVISTPDIGDVAQLLAGNGAGPVGVIVRDLSPAGYRKAAEEWLKLLAQPDIRQRCRAAAEEHLDLEKVGWQRYRQVYRSLAGKS